MKPKDITEDEFYSVLKENEIVLVDFWATWCGPCRMMAPILDELAEEMKDKLIVVKVDTGGKENERLVEEYYIESLPNLKLFKKGEVIAEFIGLKNKESLKEEIEKLI